MEELPELPFEQVLSYLSLEDCLKASTVSRGWRKKFYNYPVNCLCFSGRPSGLMLDESRWVSGAFAKNFVSSIRFGSFTRTFGQTILFNLKHLRLCDLRLHQNNRAAFAQTLQSFGQLEQLDIIRLQVKEHVYYSSLGVQLELNLPMLRSIQLKEAFGDWEVILNASRLKMVKLDSSNPDNSLKIVNGDSVERLIIDRLDRTAMKNLKNLKYLYYHDTSSIIHTLLSGLKQLKEIHLFYQEIRLVYQEQRWKISELFQQKQHYGLTDLKIYLWGLLLSGPDDPVIDSLLSYGGGETLRCLAENLWRMADEIPFRDYLHYDDIERLAPDTEISILRKFTDLKKLYVNQPVQNVQRFLELWRNLKNVKELGFSGDQPQDLFDGLPEHSSVKGLILYRAPSDFRFIFRFKTLIELHTLCLIDAETIGKLFEELSFLTYLGYIHKYRYIRIEIDQKNPKQFQVQAGLLSKRVVATLKAAIQFIEETG